MQANLCWQNAWYSLGTRFTELTLSASSKSGSNNSIESLSAGDGEFSAR